MSEQNPIKTPVLASREQLAAKAACASTLINRIWKAGFMPHDAEDVAGRPLWLASRIAEVKDLVEFVQQSRTGKVSELKWRNYEPPEPTLDDRVRDRQRFLSAWRWKEEDLAPEYKTPEVVAEWRRQYQGSEKNDDANQFIRVQK